MGVTKEKMEFKIPEGVDVEVDKGVFHVKGEEGETEKNLRHPRIKAKVEDGKVVFEVKGNSTQTTKKLMHTYRTHLQNLFKGVTEGVTYQMKVCSSHFPMTVEEDGNELKVKNYLGEKIPRTIEIPEGVDVEVDGEELTITGVNKEEVGQFAASVEKLTRRRGYDRRIFQDGIYITEKDGVEM